MSGPGVIRIVRATKRNDVNDQFIFPGLRALLETILPELARAGGGETHSTSHNQWLLKAALPFCVRFLSPPSSLEEDC